MRHLNLSRNITLLALVLAVSTSQAQWSVVNLHPAGATESYAHGFSNGLTVGEANVGDIPRACLWSGTAASWVDLNPAGGEHSRAFNAGGTSQVGYTSVGGVNCASIWSGTASSWLNINPTGSSESYARGTSGTQQVGYALIGSGFRAGIWSGSAASWVSLHPGGALHSFAVGISGAKQAGSSYFGSGVSSSIASLWTGTAASLVSLHPAGAAYSLCNGISGGQQVGEVRIFSENHAALWAGTAESFVDLNPTGVTMSSCNATHGGKQVGVAKVGNNLHASIWSGSAASWIDLHSFVPSDFTSSQARGVWSDGSGTYVVGNGFNNITQRTEALLWTLPGPANFNLTLNKASVAGQNTVIGTITMQEIKATNTVFTTHDNSSLVTTPPGVTVLAGQLSRNFQITVTAITSTVVTTIYAKRGTLTRSQTLTLTPLIPATVVCTPNPVTGGNSTSCRVGINGVAGPGGRVIAIFDNSLYTTTPNTVTVPAGATQVIFPITTIPVTSIKTVTVTARVSAGEKTGTFRINP